MLQRVGRVRVIQHLLEGGIDPLRLADFLHRSPVVAGVGRGRLLGADYSVLLVSSPNRPQLWGVNPGRWVEFDGHIHWVAKDPATGEWRLRPGMPAAVELELRRHDGAWKLPLAARGVTLDTGRQDEASRAKLARWDAKDDRPDWQMVWSRNADGPPRPLFLKLGTAQDGQFVDVQAWDPDEKLPERAQPPRVLIAAPAEKQSAGLKLF